jgi:dihydroorotate dehydrogenase (fumarate)
VKLGFRFSNILNLIGNLYNRGVQGVVLFNRFYEPDIDIDTLEVVPSQIFSDPDEKRYVLRWIAMASSQDIKINISASTGVHSAGDAIKYLLAGSDTVQVCSVLYKKGLNYLADMNRELENWMDRKGFGSIPEFRGRLNYRNIERPVIWERTQFMKYFSTED